MNWQALGAIGEVLGALAVFLTLIYLSLQIRSGNRALRTTVQDSAFHSLQEWNYHMMSDKALASVFHRGAVSIDNLDPDERAQFLHALYSFFKVWENIYMHCLAGSVSWEVWEGNCNPLFLYAQQPGIQAYLNEREAFYDPRFIELLAESGAPEGLRVGAELMGIGSDG